MSKKNKYPIVNITSLGGNNEDKIGGSCQVVEIETKDKTYRFMIDLGAKFVPYDTGYQQTFADITDYFDKTDKNGNTTPAKKTLDGVFFTHGHQDHIGAIAEVANMGYEMPPMYASEFTGAKIKRLFYKNNLETPKIRPFNNGAKINLGDKIEIEAVSLPHSALEALGMHILAKNEKGEDAIGIMHYGDFYTKDIPVGKTTDLSPYKDLISRKLITHALMDVTSINTSNAPRVEFEEAVQNTLSVIKENKGKTIISPVISGSIENIAIDIEAARRLGKKILLDGKSVREEYKDMYKSGYKDFKDVIFSGSKQAYLSEVPANEQYIVCSGAFAQGMEEFEKNQGHENNIWMSSAAKMALGLSDTHEVSKNSLFLMRQREIPEISGAYWPKMVNKLLAKGATVVSSGTESLKGKIKTKKMQDSGHIKTSELAEIYDDNITYMSVHGNKEQRSEASKIMARMSPSGKSTYFFSNLQKLNLTPDGGVEFEGKAGVQTWIAVKRENSSEDPNNPNICMKYIMINGNNEELYELCSVSENDKKEAKKQKQNTPVPQNPFEDAFKQARAVKQRKGRR
ncbi:MAG: MBL fold metallo-hydrolase [Alphaproteobacteria bacterium]